MNYIILKILHLEYTLYIYTQRLDNKDQHFTLHEMTTLIRCENSMNRNNNVLFIFHASCVKLDSCGLEQQLLRVKCVGATS